MTDDKRKILRIVAAVLIAFAAIDGLRIIAYLNRAERISGVVSAIGSEVGSKQARATVQFEYQGAKRSLQVPASRSRTHVGDLLTVLIDPKDPKDVRIEAFFRLWTIPILALIGGVACLVAAFKPPDFEAQFARRQ